MKKKCFGASDDDCGDECEHCDDANDCAQEAERRTAEKAKPVKPLVGYVTAATRHANRVHIFTEVGARHLMDEKDGPDYVVQYAVTYCGIDSRGKINGLVLHDISLDPPDIAICKVCLRKWKKGQEGKGVAI